MSNKINRPLMTIAVLALLSSCGIKSEETKPIRKDVTQTVFASGLLEADGAYSLTALVDGYLTQVNFKEGDFVSAGKTLAIIDNKENILNTQSAGELYNIARDNTSQFAPALMQAKNGIQTARQKLSLDSMQLQRYTNLLQSNSIARVDYDNVLLQYNNSKAALATAIENYRLLERQASQQLVSNKTQKQIASVVQSRNQIKAVVGGKIYKKYKQTGDYVRKGDIIALIGDAGFIYAKLNVDESNIGKIKIGQPAFIQLNTQKEKTYKGVVAEILPSFDEATQSFFCKVSFTDTLDFRIVNTQLQANITVGIQKNALLIPRNYIDFGGYVQIKGKKEKTKVETSFMSNEWVQVLSGIDENTVLTTTNIAGNKIETSEVGAQMR